MSQSNIYESNWINLVFENRNKEYGAYQLRQENTKTSLLALLVSVSFCTILFIAPKIIHNYDPETQQTTTDPIIDKVINVVNLDVTPIKPIVIPKPEIHTQQVVTERIIPKSFTNPVIVHSNEATAEVPTIEMIKNSIPVDPNAIIGTKATPGTGTTTTTVTNSTPAPIDYGNQVVNTAILDKQPSFPGGMEKFYTYIGRNFEAPEINEEKTVRFFVSFIVEKDGSMTNIHVKSDPGYNLSKEAVRVLESLKTKWAPGIIDSKPVRTSYNLPISVQMN